jgi:uncharacterized protein (UPF0332 family)
MPVPEHLQKARAFLQDAQLCVDHGRYDSAASRAYYAMFRAAIGLLEHYGDVRPGWNHGRLEQVLRRRMVSGRSLLHSGDVNELKGVYTLRITADYDDRQITAQEAQVCLANALRFITQIERIISHETHP